MVQIPGKSLFSTNLVDMAVLEALGEPILDPPLCLLLNSNIRTTTSLHPSASEIDLIISAVVLKNLNGDIICDIICNEEK